MVTIAFVALFFFAFASEGGSLWLPMALVSPAFLLPGYLVSLLMWRHFGISALRLPDVVAFSLLLVIGPLASDGNHLLRDRRLLLFFEPRCRLLKVLHLHSIVNFQDRLARVLSLSS